MAKTSEKGSKARAASVKQQERPQPEARRGAMKEVMKEVKKEMKAMKKVMKQAPRAAMKEAGQSKDAKVASSSTRSVQDSRRGRSAAYVSRQISQLSRGYAVVPGR